MNLPGGGCASSGPDRRKSGGGPTEEGLSRTPGPLAQGNSNRGTVGGDAPPRVGLGTFPPDTPGGRPGGPAEASPSRGGGSSPEGEDRIATSGPGGGCPPDQGSMGARLSPGDQTRLSPLISARLNGPSAPTGSVETDRLGEGRCVLRAGDFTRYTRSVPVEPFLDEDGAIPPAGKSATFPRDFRIRGGPIPSSINFSRQRTVTPHHAPVERQYCKAGLRFRAFHEKLPCHAGK